MHLVEQENSQPQYSTFQYFFEEKKKKNLQMATPPRKFFLLLCLSLVEPAEGGRSKLFPHFRWLLGFLHGEGNGTPLQYSCLENPMDGGAW